MATKRTTRVVAAVVASTLLITSGTGALARQQIRGTLQVGGTTGPNCPVAVPEGQPCYFGRQWNLQAIGAEEAWATGEFGSSDVRVAIVDTGIDYLHPDLAGLVDLKEGTGSVSLLSTSRSCGENEPGEPASRIQDEITKAEESNREQFQDFHSHGTAIAGVVASNGMYLAGVTRHTTLIAIKAHDRSRQNCLGVYLDGIREAVARGADVIHLSIQLEWDPREYPGSVEQVNEVTRLAHRSGAVIVAAAGNSAANIEDDGTRFRFCNADYVLCVSGTGPAGPTQPPARDTGPWTDWDRPADYTNYGRAVIDVAGPGGSGTLGGGMVTAQVPVWLICSQLAVPRPDGRPCTEPAALSQPQRVIWSSVGTSFGAAATTGLAALLVSILGHDRPNEIEGIIRGSAEDVVDVPDSDKDRAGRDDYYGRGRIDMAAAVAAALEQ